MLANRLAVALLILWAWGCSDGDPVTREALEEQPPIRRAPRPTPTAPSPGMPTGTTMPGMGPGTTDADAAQPTVRPMPDGDASAPSVPSPPELTICEDDDAGAPQEGCVVVGDLRAQYRASDTMPLDNQARPHFNLVNDGSEPIPLSEVSIRYWLTDSSSSAPFVFWCDYAQIDCANVRGEFVADPREQADHYLEVSFTGGMLGSGQQTGEVQARFNRDDWANLDENDDYSYDAAKTAFEDWHRVTLYLNGQLIWGAEPM